jgi:hypothetical protein
MLIVVPFFVVLKQPNNLLLALIATELLWIVGFTASAVLTASGLWRAYRSGMRVWIGEGINRARTLLLGMLIVGFTFVVLVPLSLSLIGLPRSATKVGGVGLALAGGAVMYAGPVAILLILDRLSRRVVADCPGKFGPKVPAVGKWNS